MNALLDKFVLPYPIKYLTNRLVILATLCLLVPLIALAADQAFINAINSYLNVMSVVVSSTVLLYATISEARDKEASRRREEIAEWNQRTLIQRAEEDHRLIEQILQNSMALMTDRFAQMQADDQRRDEAMYNEVMASNEARRSEIANLARQIQAMQQPPAPPN